MFLFLVVLAIPALMSCAVAGSPSSTGQDDFPLWTTGSRLLKLGESIEFKFRLPERTPSQALRIYPRYLENADPGAEFKAGGGLDWVRKLKHERIPLDFHGGEASAVYSPKRAGSYLAEWEVGSERYYRYFAVVEDDYVVLNFSTFFGLESRPDLHATGIPLDYRLPIKQFDPNDKLFLRLLDNNQRFGDLVVPLFPDTLELSHEERVKQYGEGMQKVRSLIPDPNDTRSIRVDMWHEADPGYVRAFAEMSINDHCGLWEANCKPWLGMPEFPYFSSPEDCRKMNLNAGASVVSHQWDCCASFHFLGPVQWHYAASEGRIHVAEKCFREGLAEYSNLASMSGHPAFVTPLYDGIEKNPAFGVFSEGYPNPTYPNPVFQDGYGGKGISNFVEEYQRLFAFRFTKDYKLVYARSIDIVDYYLRHFKTTPRTVFLSKTSHLLYDAWWTQGTVANYGVLITPEKIPWVTRVSMVHKMRKEAHLPRMKDVVPLKDPMSCEFILIEEQERQIRFERECPNPIWWFDYTRDEKTADGSVINAVETPDVLIGRSQSFDESTGLTIKLTMHTEAEFPDYAIALWNVPVDFHAAPGDVETNAKKYELVRNTNGEVHMVLHFDLKPSKEISIVLMRPTSDRWEW